MLAPDLRLTTDATRSIATVSVEGPLATDDHADAFAATCSIPPPGMTLVINLTGLTSLTDNGLSCLREVARWAASRGQTVVFVCADLMMRRELVLADLDSLAPVVEATELAVALAA